MLPPQAIPKNLKRTASALGDSETAEGAAPRKRLLRPAASSGASVSIADSSISGVPAAAVDKPSHCDTSATQDNEDTTTSVEVAYPSLQAALKRSNALIQDMEKEFGAELKAVNIQTSDQPGSEGVDAFIKRIDQHLSSA